MGRSPRIALVLDPIEMDELRTLLSGGVRSVRVIRRAQCLLLLTDGKSVIQVGNAIGISAQSVRNTVRRHSRDKLAGILHEKPRPGAQRRLDDKQEKRIIALACTDAPEGRSRWRVRLIAAEAIKKKIVDTVGRETIRLLLERHELKPWREKNVVYPRIE